MKSEAVEIAAHFEKKPSPETDDLITITFTRDHSWLDAMQMLQDLQESGSLQEERKRIHWCIWPNAPIIEEVAALMIETLEFNADASRDDSSSKANVQWEQFVFQDLDQSNEYHCRILSTVCRMELFQSLWIGGRNDQQMSRQSAVDLSHAISKNTVIEEISIFLKLMDECFPILGEGLENAKNQKKLSLHLNLSDTMYNGSSPLAIEFQHGIEQCTHLRQLDLDGFPIKWLYSLFEALENSPIETLCLKKCQWEEESEDSSLPKEEVLPPLRNQVARYLSSGECPLKTLDLSYPSSSINVSRLISSLERNASLQTMRLRHAGLVASDLAELLAITTSAKSVPMRELDLRGNSISLLDLSNLVRNIETTRNAIVHKDAVEDPLTTQLSRINLDGNRNNHIWPEEDAKKIQKVLLWLLGRYPSLDFFGDRFARSYLCDPLVQHAMDMNRLGTRRWRRTINNTTDPSTTTSTASSSFPMALWPYMLERPTRMLSKEPNRQASVVFRLVVDGVGTMLALHEAG